MRRADRLFRIVQRLRRGGVVTASALAEKLEVSERTIYRDMRELMGAGLPLDGEAGVGYLLRGSLDLPPLTFTHAELEALVLGARLVRAWGGGDLATAAAQALDKLTAAVPDGEEAEAGALLFAPGEVPTELRHRLDQVRTAINGRRVLAFAYQDAEGRVTERTIHPLGLFFWGKVWTLVAWCELRDAFRHFRVDRIETLRSLERTFEPVPGRTLVDFIAEVSEECGETLQRDGFPFPSQPEVK